MNKRKWQSVIRKSHRFLGVFFGVQFLFWTLGGLYFSWTKIQKIRGEDIRKEEPALNLEASNANINTIVQQIKLKDTFEYCKNIQLVDILGSTFYQITFFNGIKLKTVLADVKTGSVRSPINKTEAIKIAESRLNIQGKVSAVEYISQTDGHHEYRDKPLPAYAITFTGNTNTTVYVAAEMGSVQSFRNNQWRVFDFLWMLHVMDYENRDNINNWVLRIFSIIGLITIISGFLIYMITYKR